MRPFGVLLAFLCSAILAADWPQWRGPKRDGHSADTKLLEEWPEEGPKLLWSVKDADGIGTGYGQPAVVKGKVFLLGGTGARQNATEFVTCLNARDGTQVWQTKLETSRGNYSDGWGGGPRSTPTVDGDRVFVLGATGDLVCLSADKGKVLWTKNLVKDFNGSIPGWGYCESPLVDGDQLVCTPGGRGGLVALDKTNGKLLWACKDIKDSAGYSSVMIAEVGGVKQYVQQTMSSALGVRAKDGKLLWKEGEIARRVAVIPSPVIHGDHVFITAGYGAGCECFKLEKDGDGTKATLVYTNRVMQNQHGGVVRVGDYGYGYSDSGAWMCIDLKKGGDKPVWQHRGIGKGSISAAGGYLYCYSESDGTLARVKASEKKYEEAGKFKIPQLSKLRPGSGKVWAHPVIADGKLFLRDYEMLYVYDLSK